MEFFEMKISTVQIAMLTLMKVRLMDSWLIICQILDGTKWFAKTVMSQSSPLKGLQMLV
jgi:hypothetical protein